MARLADGSGLGEERRGSERSHILAFLDVPKRLCVSGLHRDDRPISERHDVLLPYEGRIQGYDRSICSISLLSAYSLQR